MKPPVLRKRGQEEKTRKKLCCFAFSEKEIYQPRFFDNFKDKILTKECGKRL